MITIAVARDSESRVTGFSVRGHSDFAEEGQDIVCAAVSTLVQAAVVGIEEILQIDPGRVRVQGHYMVELPAMIPPDRAAKAYFLMETVYRSFRGISEGYPGYIFFEEVLGVGEKNKKYDWETIRVSDRHRRKEVDASKGGNGMGEMNGDDYMEKEEKKKVPWDKLLGVALLGAVSSALLYYIFLQLGEEQKQAMKDFIVSQGKQLVAKAAHPEDD